jgi:N-acetylmuramoyl-L-alanine amidase
VILAVLCLCQLAAQPAGGITVRAAEGEARAAVAVVNGVRYVAWSELQRAGARSRTLPNGRVSLELAGVQMELAHGVPFVRVGDAVVPLAAAPRLLGDSVAVPLQIIAQVLPRYATAAKYTHENRTLALVPEPRAARRIIIDAGHGGADNGTSVTLRNGTRITEKSIALSISTSLGSELRKRGFEIVQTRTSDTLIALHDRGKIANASNGSAFVSIHVNSAGPAQSKSAARGVETYFLSVARTEDARRLQLLENSAVQFEDASEGGGQNDPLSFILSDMRQNDHLKKSSTLAQRIQGSLARMHPGGNRGVKQAEFVVLVGSFMPSVLVEVGFLSNESDATFLAKKENQSRIAVSIADGIEAYFKGLDGQPTAAGAGR